MSSADDIQAGIYGRPEFQFPQLEMVRQHLEDIPRLELPEGYALRGFSSGDDRMWCEMLCQAFGATWSVKQFRMMRGHFGFSRERVIFLCYRGEPVGSASAYQWPGIPADLGYIHMVGLRRAHIGKGLGRALTIACLSRFREDGIFHSAMLQTETYRLPAIKHYIRLGFVPSLVHEQQRRQWQEILSQISMPEKIEEFGLPGLPVMPASAFYIKTIKVYGYTLWLNMKYLFR